jgi:DNA repair exonuclease SbcCD ATPase subunit
MNLTKYTDFLSEKKATKKLLESKAKDLKAEIVSHQHNLVDLEKALEVMNTVSVLVQQEFEEVVEVLVTQALRFVFGDNHSLKLEGNISHNQPEVHMYLVIDGEKFSPKDDEFSGGQADVVSFALRIILWAIQYKRTRPVLLFDEPFRNLHGLKNAAAVREMVQYLAKTMSLQFIIITQDEDLVEVADAAFMVTNSEGVSSVELLDKIIVDSRIDNYVSTS